MRYSWIITDTNGNYITSFIATPKLAQTKLQNYRVWYRDAKLERF